jgi:hypothetical protein
LVCLVWSGVRWRAWGSLLVVQMGVRSNGFRITERDEAIVRFVGLQVGAEARQVAVWQAMDRAHVFRRCKRLVELGLLRQERVVHGRPGLHLATKAGLEFAGLSLPAARVNLLELPARGRARLALHRPGARVRPRRRPDRAPDPLARVRRRLVGRALVRAAPAALRARGRRRAAQPALPRPGRRRRRAERRHAVRRARAVSQGERRRAIVRSYLRSAQVERARYYAVGDAFAALQRTVNEERAQDIVELREWWPTTTVGR